MQLEIYAAAKTSGGDIFLNSDGIEEVRESFVKLPLSYRDFESGYGMCDFNLCCGLAYKPVAGMDTD